jgi:hypothetical protein
MNRARINTFRTAAIATGAALVLGAGCFLVAKNHMLPEPMQAAITSSQEYALGKGRKGTIFTLKTEALGTAVSSGKLPISLAEKLQARIILKVVGTPGELGKRSRVAVSLELEMPFTYHPFHLTPEQVKAVNGEGKGTIATPDGVIHVSSGPVGAGVMAAGESKIFKLKSKLDDRHFLVINTDTGAAEDCVMLRVNEKRRVSVQVNYLGEKDGNYDFAVKIL